MGGKHVGFNSEKAMVACTYLSVMYSHNWAREVELVTDKAGYELLVEKYKIPYSNVVVCLDELNDVSKLHWSLGKMKACAIQEKPFMHQDNDVIWFKPPPKRVRSAPSLFQNLEHEHFHHKYYKCMMDHADMFFEKKKPFVDYKTLNAVNCGVMAFNDLSAINDWYSYAFDYIEYYDKYRLHEGECEVLSPIIFEQLHLYYFLTHYGIPIQYLEEKTNNFVSDVTAEELGYTHLIAHSKRNSDVEQRVLQRIKEEFPKFHASLIKM